MKFYMYGVLFCMENVSRMLLFQFIYLFFNYFDYLAI